MLNKTKVIEKYKGIHLGYYDYKDTEYYIDDFLDENFVINWIIDTASEADQGITYEGINFINEYYGNNYIIDKVLEKSPKFTFGYGDPYEFLENHRDRSYSAKKE